MHILIIGELINDSRSKTLLFHCFFLNIQLYQLFRWTLSVQQILSLHNVVFLVRTWWKWSRQAINLSIFLCFIVATLIITLLFEINRVTNDVMWNLPYNSQVRENHPLQITDYKNSKIFFNSPTRFTRKLSDMSLFKCGSFDRCVPELMVSFWIQRTLQLNTYYKEIGIYYGFINNQRQIVEHITLSKHDNTHLI